MGHEDDGFGTMVDSIFDGREGSGYSLVVCDILVRVKWNVEVDLEHGQLRTEGVSKQGTYSDQDSLVLEIAVGDGELV
jgi:hypothetical protein